MATRDARLHVPVRGPEDVILHLARGELHWKAGCSAHALATSWFSANGLPAAVKTVLDSCDPFTSSTLLEAFFERETDLRDGLGRGSQTDLLALVRTRGGVAVVAVEGKVEESFGALIGNRAALSPGQQERLRGLCRLFEVDEAHLGPLRYQLLHRAAAAVFEADRYGAKTCMLLVHSFSPHHTGRIDFERFCDSLGLGGSGDMRGPIDVLGVQLYAAWVADRLAVATPERKSIRQLRGGHRPCRPALSAASTCCTRKSGTSDHL